MYSAPIMSIGLGILWPTAYFGIMTSVCNSAILMNMLQKCAADLVIWHISGWYNNWVALYNSLCRDVPLCR